jgi:hypothetical protein
MRRLFPTLAGLLILLPPCSSPMWASDLPELEQEWITQKEKLFRLQAEQQILQLEKSWLGGVNPDPRGGQPEASDRLEIPIQNVLSASLQQRQKVLLQLSDAFDSEQQTTLEKWRQAVALDQQFTRELARAEEHYGFTWEQSASFPWFDGNTGGVLLLGILLAVSAVLMVVWLWRRRVRKWWRSRELAVPVLFRHKRS